MSEPGGAAKLGRGRPIGGHRSRPIREELGGQPLAGIDCGVKALKPSIPLVSQLSNPETVFGLERALPLGPFLGEGLSPSLTALFLRFELRSGFALQALAPGTEGLL